MKPRVWIILCLTAAPPELLWPADGFRAAVAKTWDEAALAEWAMPLAGLNARPAEMSAKEYYSLAVDNLATYPVYFPEREPAGYWEVLQHTGPHPLIELEKLRTKADWIAAGRRVFEEMDHIHLRTFDAKLIAAARSKATFAGKVPQPDGTIADLRWVPTKLGIALGFRNCASCHVAHRPDGTSIPGAPAPITGQFVTALLAQAQAATNGAGVVAPFLLAPEPIGMRLYRTSGVPWRNDDINEQMKSLTETDLAGLRTAFARSGGTLRWNGSLYFPAKIPDLIGIQDRKYIDHTATHQHRSIGDLMRYAALVSFAEAADFGPYHMLGAQGRRVQARLPDEALYALALYIYSLEPPRNPNPFDDQAKAGQRIFVRENCVVCHTPPLYTSNKITLAEGFEPPQDTSASLDVLRVSVRTDPGLALMTRKGTGYYKIPSLKGVWYRGHYLHDGSAASLEEMLDPDRLRETHVPGGWMPPGAKSHAIKGHEFGLKLKADERRQLIAFLRTL